MSYRKPHDEERPLPDPKLDLDALHVRADGRRQVLHHRWLLMLSMLLQHGRKGAAYRLGVTDKTLRNEMTRFYGRLGARDMFEAACALGWFRIPADLLDAPPMGPDSSGSQGGRSVAGPDSGAAAGTAAPTTTGRSA